MSDTQHRSLASFYFWYFALLGCMVPYWSLYLRELGFAPQWIGLVVAIPMFTKIFAPLLWGWLADKRGNRVQIIRLGAVLTCLSAVPLIWVDTLWPIVAVMLAYSFFHNAVLPQVEVVTLQSLHANAADYSRIRVWGSIGYVVFVLILGYFLDYFPLHWLPVAMVICLGLIVGSSYRLQVVATETHSDATPERQPFMQTVLAPAALVYFIAVFLMQASHGSYYGFYSIHLADLGYSKSAIGWLWSVGVLAEILLFFYMPRLMVRYSLRAILIFSLSIATVRWVLIGFYAEYASVVFFSQLLHAATFGSFHVASIQVVHRLFAAENAGKGQALYSSASYGAGGALGAYASGWLWMHGQAPSVFGTAAILAGIGALLLVLFARGRAFA